MNKSNVTQSLLAGNAVLLGVLVMLQFSDGGVQTAEAYQETPRRGIPNAAEQRQMMIKKLDDLQASIDATRKSIESGTLNVNVSNIDDLRADG